MNQFEHIVREIVSDRALCESIVDGYHAYLESSEGSVPTKSILDGTPLASSGTFDMNGVFTPRESMQAALVLGEEIRKEGAASGDDPTETKYWRVAQVVRSRIEQSGQQKLLDAFNRGVNSKMKQFGVKF